MLPKNLLVLLVFCGSCLPWTTESALAQQRLPRILQGQETDDFPAVGIVGSVRSGGFCTGTLISPTHVLTAAHCAEVIESDTSGTFEVNGQLYATESVLIHPDYNFFTLANDLAILQLNEPVLDVEPSLIFRDAPLVGDLLSIVGFGADGTADGGSDGTFGTKRVGVTTIDEVTSTLVSWTFDDENESNTASGDSGGPGYIAIDGQWFVACVTSGGTEPDSALGDFAFNTRVDAFAGWIDLTIAIADEPSTDEPSTDEPSTDEPSTDEPGTDEPSTPDEEDADDGFWSKPFPFLQFLIDFLTQLLEFLTGITVDQGVEAVETPAETPSDTTEPTQDPDQPAGETPAEDTTDDPVECPPTTPVETPESADETSDEETPQDENPVETTDESVPPADEIIPVIEEVIPPTQVIPPAGVTPGGGVAGGGAAATPVGEAQGGGAAAPTSLTSASVLASWNRAIEMRARSRAQNSYERLILSGTDSDQ